MQMSSMQTRKRKSTPDYKEECLDFKCISAPRTNEVTNEFIWSNLSIFQTRDKGLGLRAEVDISKDTFIPIGGVRISKANITELENKKRSDPLKYIIGTLLYIIYIYTCRH